MGTAHAIVRQQLQQMEQLKKLTCIPTGLTKEVISILTARILGINSGKDMEVKSVIV
jgi:hypothetical protein